MIPVLMKTENLKSKTGDIKQMRDNVSKAITIIFNVHLELSVTRKMSLKPFKDKKKSFISSATTMKKYVSIFLELI